MEPKVEVTGGKNDRLDLSKFKTFVLPITASTGWKDSAENGRKYTPVLFLIREVWEQYK